LYLSALALLLALPVYAQESGPPQEPQAANADGATQPGQTDRRVIDRPIRGSGSLAIVKVLKSPFHVLDKGIDKGLAKVEKGHLLERAEDLQVWLHKKGYQPLFGGLGMGAGFSLGVDVFRENLLGTGVRLDIPMQISTHRYVGLGGFLKFSFLPADKLFLKTGFEYQDRPQEDFFGLGNDSSEANRSNYELEKKSVEVTLGSRLRKNLILGFPVRFQNTNVGRGSDNRHPDLQDRFTVGGIPGAESGAELFSVGGFLEWDYRNNPAYPTWGGIWRMEAHYFRDTNDQDFRFMRYRVESSHYVPLDDEHGFAVRTLAVFNDNKGRSAVPFFEKAILGGGDTMRGFREFRFYDDSALLFNVEYRWQIWTFADAVLFVDEGQVARRPRDFSLEGFRNSHGLGLRFKSKRGQMFRVDVGHSSEGWRVYFTFSPKF
jgi:outer membrane protein assembly factor BamA